MRRKSLTLVVLALIVTGCASAEKEKKREEELTEARNHIQSLNQKIGDLETKLAAMTDKLAITQSTVENLMQIKKPVTSGVDGHPAENRGKRVAPVTAKGDPEGGFVNDAAIANYRQAMILFEAQKLPEAVLAFSSFLERYPDHALAGSAQYYVGECYYRQKEYKLAHQEYQRVLTSYDRSPHIANTLARMADTAEILKKPEEAAKHRQMLTSLFPMSPAASSSKEIQAEPAPAAPAAKSEPTHGSETKAPALDEPPPTAPVPKEEESH